MKREKRKKQKKQKKKEYKTRLWQSNKGIKNMIDFSWVYYKMIRPYIIIFVYIYILSYTGIVVDPFQICISFLHINVITLSAWQK
jgi:hypothetical protein